MSIDSVMCVEWKCVVVTVVERTRAADLVQGVVKVVVDVGFVVVEE